MDKIKAMRKAGSIGESIFRRFQYILEPGIATQSLDDFAKKCIEANGAIATFLGYGNPPYPASICVSLNEEICHGIPSRRTISGSDLVSIDMGIGYEGFTVDA
ncbi:MAG: M24 family metallopeptidase, partial [Candidatus Hodarchaeales archaeon]